MRAPLVADVLIPTIRSAAIHKNCGYTPRDKHKANKKVQQLSLRKLMVAELNYIGNTLIIGAYIIFD